MIAFKNFWDSGSKVRVKYLRITFSGKMFGVHLMESNPDENNVKDNTFILLPDKVKYILGFNFWLLPNYSNFFSFTYILGQGWIITWGPFKYVAGKMGQIHYWLAQKLCERAFDKILWLFIGKFALLIYNSLQNSQWI